MKEFENFELIKKKFSPLLFIFRKDEENEIKNYLRKSSLVNLIKNYKSAKVGEQGITASGRPNYFMTNRLPNHLEKPFYIFNKYNGNNISERGKFFSTVESNKNGELTYQHHNNALNKALLNSKYFPSILNNKLVRYTNDEELDLDELEKEYIVVKKVYTFVQEGPSMYMYIY
ncbi:conserved Plasmodium protein, unknown function [Plasmodium ovale curtisi]|uniref:Uncharacterized protein n=1 Tax=Plasmodium ovale curtisi TaxID=864141 RepID=A0A1A8VMK1_PLAOA|nr:conserved Plasmodium protein, unknown function [Plasmodium ovale curtisi]